MSGRTRHAPRPGPRPSRRGFTLLETVLASVVGSMVLLAALSLFLSLSRAERTFAARFDQTTQMAWLQMTVRRALLSLVMDENTSVDENGERVVGGDDEVPPRWRIMLSPDPLAEAYVQTGRWARPDGPAQVQRLEVVLDAPPVPDALMGPAAGWASRAPADAMDFSLADVAGEDTGGVRGVFELRPDGVREKLMRAVGLGARDWPVRAEGDDASGWTLWWREYSPAEIGGLTAGGQPLPDDIESPEGQDRLVRSYPLVRGIEAIRWQVFSDGQRVPAYAGLAQKQLPAYIELEIRTTTGKYANWMFEVGWRVGADPSEDDESDDTADDEAEGDSPRLRDGGGAGGGPRGSRFGAGDGSRFDRGSAPMRGRGVRRPARGDDS